MMHLAEFKDEDWFRIEDAVEPFSADGPIDMIGQGVSVTATEDGKVMACGGIILHGDEGAVWVRVSSKCKEKSYRWARNFKETFRIMLESVGDIKVCTYILSDFCEGERLAKLIGLEKTDESRERDGRIYYKYMAVT